MNNMLVICCNKFLYIVNRIDHLSFVCQKVLVLVQTSFIANIHVTVMAEILTALHWCIKS
jgi:hypothetical protein